MNRHDVATAFLASWLICGAVLLPVLTGPVVVSEDTLAAISPQCWSVRHTGDECFMCGMTRGFCAIGRGDFASARAANAGAIPLYMAMSLNELAALTVSMKLAGRVRRLLKRKRLELVTTFRGCGACRPSV